MPSHLDILLERLRQFDEITILELLDISTDELLVRFRDRVIANRDTLYGEVEIFVEDEEDYTEELDGFQIEETEE